MVGPHPSLCCNSIFQRHNKSIFAVRGLRDERTERNERYPACRSTDPCTRASDRGSGRKLCEREPHLSALLPAAPSYPHPRGQATCRLRLYRRPCSGWQDANPACTHQSPSSPLCRAAPAAPCCCSLTPRPSLPLPANTRSGFTCFLSFRLV